MGKRVTILEPAVVYNYWREFSYSSLRSLGGAEPEPSENPTIPDTFSTESINSEGNDTSNADGKNISDKKEPLGSDEADDAVGKNIADNKEPLGSDQADEDTKAVQNFEDAPTSEDDAPTSEDDVDADAGKDSRLGTSEVFLFNSGDATSPSLHRSSSRSAPPAEDGVTIQETEGGLEWIHALEEHDIVESYGRVSFPETDAASVSLEADWISQIIDCVSVGEASLREDHELDADVPSGRVNSVSSGKLVLVDAVTLRSSAGATSRSSGGATPRGSTMRKYSSLKGSKSGSLTKKASTTGSDKIRSSEVSTGSKKAKENVEGSTESKTTSVVKVEDECQKKNNARVIKFDPEKPFSDDCVRFKECCPCCHCKAVRCAIRKASFYLTPQGQRQLEAKRDMKNFFMDINAMSEVRWRIEAKLHGTKDPFPSSQLGFPICITEVKRLDKMCLYLTWYIHDYDNIGHYEICVDGRRKKIVHNPQQTKTILMDVNATCNHTIIMRALPKVDPKRAQGERLVQILCCEGGLQHAFSCKEDPLKVALPCGAGRDEERKNLLEFWKPCEFFYIPQCKCQDECDCDWSD